MLDCNIINSMFFGVCLLSSYFRIMEPKWNHEVHRLFSWFSQNEQRATDQFPLLNLSRVFHTLCAAMPTALEDSPLYTRQAIMGWVSPKQTNEIDNQRRCCSAPLLRQPQRCWECESLFFCRWWMVSCPKALSLQNNDWRIVAPQVRAAWALTVAPSCPIMF